MISTLDDAPVDLKTSQFRRALDEWAARELAPDEDVIWAGRPHPRQAFRQLLPTIMAGLYTIGVGVIFDFMAWGRMGPNDPYVLIAGATTVVVGLSQLVVAIRHARGATRAIYFLSNQRAAVVTPARDGSVQVDSFHARALGGTVRRERFDGSGDLIFEEVAPPEPWTNRQLRARGFLAIEDVHAVERLVRSTLLA